MLQARHAQCRLKKKVFIAHLQKVIDANFLSFWYIFSKSSQTGCHVHLLGKTDVTVSPHSWEVIDPFLLKVYSWSSVVYQLHCKYAKYIIWLWYVTRKDTHTVPIILFFSWVPFSLTTWPVCAVFPLHITYHLTSHMKQDTVSGMMHTDIHNICTQIQKNTRLSFSLQQKQNLARVCALMQHRSFF